MENSFIRKFTTWLFLVSFLWTTLSGCNHRTNLHQNTNLIAGTFVTVVSTTEKAAPIVFKTMRGLEEIFNLYDNKSEIARVNKNAGRKHTKVSPEFIELLQTALEISAKTKGAFDPTIGKISEFWKGKIKKNQTKDLQAQWKEKADKIKKSRGTEFIKVDSEKQTVYISKKKIALDLGGIAKGYMVDKAIDRLNKNQIQSALVNAGGDIYCLGTPPERKWLIGLRNPKNKNAVIKKIKLKNQAVATSGDYEQFIEYKKNKYTHIIEPKTGKPVKNSVRSITVIAKNTTTADALATAFFVMNKSQLKKFIENTALKLKVFVISEKNNKLSLKKYQSY